MFDDAPGFLNDRTNVDCVNIFRGNLDKFNYFLSVINVFRVGFFGRQDENVDVLWFLCFGSKQEDGGRIKAARSSDNGSGFISVFEGFLDKAGD